MAVKEMTDEELNAHFRELVDLFIDQGNELAKKSNSENVSLALLHAASRYNAYVVASHAESFDQYEQDIADAKSYFQSQYSNMLDENFEDYKQVYINKPNDANAH